MATLKFFGNLRQMAGKATLVVDGQTVGEVLANLRLQNASVHAALLEDSKLKPYYKVMLNGMDISLHQGLNTTVNDRDVVAIFPPIAGGLA
jgi:molybdopterin synthase sulfur carrier subunit